MNQRTLESHPELVFAALANRPIPRGGSKAVLLGLLARISLLSEKDIPVTLASLPWLPAIETHNYLDAAAMSVVALVWSRLHGELRVIRHENGAAERLSDADQHLPLMALPCEGFGLPAPDPLCRNDLSALARNACIATTQLRQDDDAGPDPMA